MVKKVFGLAALFAALIMVCLSGASQAQQIHMGEAKPGGPPVGTEEPCILNSCLLYAGDFDINGQNPNGLWNGTNTVFNITGVVYIPITIPKKFKGAKGKTDWQVEGSL